MNSSKLTESRKLQRERQISVSKKYIDRYNDTYNIYRSYISTGNWSLFKAIENIDRDKVFADFGCLDGTIAYTFAQVCTASYGIDLPEITKNIIFKYPNLKYMGMDLDINFPKHIKFDVILAIDLIDCLWNDVEFMKQCYESMKHGSKLIIAVPIEVVDSNIPFRLYGTDSFNKLLCSAPFTILEKHKDSMFHAILEK